MLVDFVQFFAHFIIAATILRLLQAKSVGTKWEQPLAFLA